MRIFCLFFCCMLGSAVAGSQPLQRVAPEQVGMDSQRLLWADHTVCQAITENNISGAVLAVVRHGKMAYLKAYGKASLVAKAAPMTATGIFDMASCSTSITTLCVMILAEQGRLHLTDPVNFHIPGFRNWQSRDGKETQAIRIRDLMTHSSGLPPYADLQKPGKKDGSPSPQTLMEHIATCPRDFRPQSHFQYSALNSITLQHIVETISGQPLREFAREHIFNVLNMKHTDYLPYAQDREGNWGNAKELPEWVSLIVPTEKPKEGQLLRAQVQDRPVRIMNGDIPDHASVFSCAGDIAKLCATLQNGGEWDGHRILSPMGMKAMRSIFSLGHASDRDSFSTFSPDNGDLFGRNTYRLTDDRAGISIVIDPDTDTGVILLANAVHPENARGVAHLRSSVSNAVAASILDREGMAPYHRHYYERFLQFMDEPPITTEDIVMLGNSLTENGGDWSKRLNREHVVNRGITGDEVMGVYRRLHQILPGQPRELFLMIGINDVSHGLSADSIAERIRHTVERIRRESPHTRLHLQSLLPINESFGRYRLLKDKTELVPEINARLKTLALDRQIDFIDIFPLFTEKGTHVLRKELSTDGLHLNEEGYKIWAEELKKRW